MIKVFGVDGMKSLLEDKCNNLELQGWQIISVVNVANVNSLYSLYIIARKD